MEKILKKNLWNKIFNGPILQEQERKYKKLSYLLSEKKSESFEKEIRACRSLKLLKHAHQRMWNWGYRNENIGPNPFGMFRTENISSMKDSEVFLGNIYGLCTKPISYWENCLDEQIGPNGFGVPEGERIYTIILEQYRSLLKSNLHLLVEEMKQYIKEYEKLNL